MDRRGRRRRGLRSQDGSRSPLRAPEPREPASSWVKAGRCGHDLGRQEQKFACRRRVRCLGCGCSVDQEDTGASGAAVQTRDGRQVCAVRSPDRVDQALGVSTGSAPQMRQLEQFVRRRATVACDQPDRRWPTRCLARRGASGGGPEARRDPCVARHKVWPPVVRQERVRPGQLVRPTDR